MPTVLLTEAERDVSHTNRENPARHAPYAQASHGEESRTPQGSALFQTPSLEDQHVAQRVDCALRETDYWALHAVRVSVRSRVVFLEGRVPSYYLKQLAQETARTVPGTHQICNGLEVVQTE